MLVNPSWGEFNKCAPNSTKEIHCGPRFCRSVLMWSSSGFAYFIPIHARKQGGTKPLLHWELHGKFIPHVSHHEWLFKKWEPVQNILPPTSPLVSSYLLEFVVWTVKWPFIDPSQRERAPIIFYLYFIVLLPCRKQSKTTFDKSFEVHHVGERFHVFLAGETLIFALKNAGTP